MTEFRVPVRNAVLSQHWPPLTRKDIHKYNYTKKRIPCAGAQCCAFTTLTTSDTEKVQKCHPVEWLTATQNIHFWVPVIVNFTHYRDIKTPLYRVIPGTRATWEAPRAREPTYQVGRQLQKTSISWVSHPSAGFLDLTLGLVLPGHFPSDLEAR